MKKIITVLIIIHCCFKFTEAQWVKQLSPSHFITDIEFINKYTGWACGNNIIYKTTNEGQSWISQPNSSTNLIMQIHPVNENVVYAVGWWNFLKNNRRR